ncbi:MAG TPA: hypothetical protein VE783_06725 [Candidatus Limnocylindrales bacterium]|nr:hypothetical protein [Candidatus Limnocylindrales bacterium]
MKLYLHIDRLVLDGIPLERTQRGRVRAAVEQELARLLKSGGLARDLRSGSAVPAVQGRNMHLQKGRQYTDLGRQIAGAVYSGIGNKRK